MALAFEELKVRLTGLDSVLGSVALNKEVFSEFLVNKTKTKEEKEAALADLENIEENTEKGTTGFYRDENGKLIMKGYQVKGFLKESMKALKDQLEIKSYLSKVDNYVFVLERNIPIMRDGYSWKNLTDFWRDHSVQRLCRDLEYLWQDQKKLCVIGMSTLLSV